MKCIVLNGVYSIKLCNYSIIALQDNPRGDEITSSCRMGTVKLQCSGAVVE